MLYFSLPAYHYGGRRHIHHGPPLSKTGIVIVMSVLWLCCFPIMVPIMISESIERTKTRRRQDQSPAAVEWRKKFHERRAKEKAFKKQRSKGKPRLQPRTRKRSLTLLPVLGSYPSTSSVSIIEMKIGIRKGITQQNSSSLLGLPPNVRQRIWEFVLGGHTIAIYCGKSRLDHAFEGETDTDGEIYGSGEPNFAPGATKSHLSALLKTCRQVYSEAINILYTQNTFSLYQNNTLFDLQSTILPQRFSSIRLLILHWQFRDDETFERDIFGNQTKVEAPWDVGTWRNACKILSENMPLLQSLFVITRGPFIMNNGIVDMLQSLRGIRVEKDSFRVRIPWPRIISWTKDATVDRSFENHDFPFQVVRTGKVIPDIDPGPEIYELDADRQYLHEHGQHIYSN